MPSRSSLRTTDHLSLPSALAASITMGVFAGCGDSEGTDEDGSTGSSSTGTSSSGGGSSLGTTTSSSSSTSIGTETSGTGGATSSGTTGSSTDDDPGSGDTWVDESSGTAGVEESGVSSESTGLSEESEGSSGVEESGETGEPCEPGYLEQDGGCEDLDECAQNEPVCGRNTTCENTIGSFSCSCWPEFQGDPADLCCPIPPSDPVSPSIALSIGHVDTMAAVYECNTGALSVSTKDDTSPIGGAIYRDIDSVLIHGNADAALVVPEDLYPEWSFVGPAGTTVWILPESQIQTVVWPGWDSAAVAPGVFDGDALTLRLTSIEGPGRFVGYYADAIPTILLDPENGVDATTMYAGSHSHMNWFFSEPGFYRLDFELQGTTQGGAYTSTTWARLRFFLGELEDLPESEPTVISLAGVEPQYDAGETLELTATLHGEPSELPITWLEQCLVEPGQEEPEVTPWAPLATGASLAYVLVPDDRYCQYRAALFAGDTEIATSQAVAPTIYF